MLGAVLALAVGLILVLPEPRSRIRYWSATVSSLYNKKVPPYDGSVIHNAPGIASLETVTHADRTVYKRYKTVVARLKALPNEFEQGLGIHPSMLGELELEPLAFSGLSEFPTISISSTPPQHAKLTAVRARVNHDAKGKFWDPTELRNSAEKFLVESGDLIDLASVACMWVNTELWKAFASITVSRAEASEFCAVHQPNLLIQMLMPAWTKSTSLFGFEEFKTRQKKYFQRILTSKILASETEDPERAKMVAQGMLDAIGVAGGLSAPALITKTIAALYNGTTLHPYYQMPILLHDTRLEQREVLRALVLEVARLFPEVSHVPIDRSDGSKELLCLSCALRDPSVWGEDADAFNLDRDLDLSGPYGLIWAHPANVGGAISRGCPAMGMSLAMIEAFVGVYASQSHMWQPQENIQFPGGGVVTRLA